MPDSEKPRVSHGDAFFYSAAVLEGKRKDIAYMPAITTIAKMILLIRESCPPKTAAIRSNPKKPMSPQLSAPIMISIRTVYLKKSLLSLWILLTVKEILIHGMYIYDIIKVSEPLSFQLLCLAGD